MSSLGMSSPVSISPTRRRSLSPSEISDGNSIRPPRHSPTLTRSFDPNDPQVRERQRTMDVDMALQLSLARRETMHSSPVATFASPGGQQPIPDLSFPQNMASETNEDLQNDSPGEETMNDNEVDSTLPLDNDIAPQRRSEPSLHLQMTEDPQASNFGLPTYQANVSQSAFDFAPMEEWASAEKTKLGLSTPHNTHFSVSAIRGRAQIVPEAPVSGSPPNTVLPEPTALNSGSFNETAIASGSNLVPQPAEQGSSLGVEDTHSDKPLRLRKLSQSNPHPRSHRKGIGGKMALFESTPADISSFSARIGLALGTQGGHIPSGPSYDNIAGVPHTGPGGGILNTGHDRPYRFSFYSNALSATIHARSLSELPAEGQTFEQLFSGIQPQPQSSGDDGMLGKDRTSASSPPYQDTGKSSHGGGGFGNFSPSNNGVNVNGNPSSNGARRFGLGPEKIPPGGGANPTTIPDDQDGNTWWLDVQNPTDEEMKMLSKVNISYTTLNDNIYLNFLFRFSLSIPSQLKIFSWKKRVKR